MYLMKEILTSTRSLLLYQPLPLFYPFSLVSENNHDLPSQLAVTESVTQQSGLKQKAAKPSFTVIAH